jgi:4-hydroxy-3-methylbut-2-enyl diphosphate reductase
MQINIDNSAGFCFGVLKTIEKAEKAISNESNKNIYVLGEIIHNPHEIDRLSAIGLKTIELEQLNSLDTNNSIVIIRAHGEPPSTYQKLNILKLKYIDATCPLVKRLQDKITEYYKTPWQIIIFGKAEHPEVIGLRGVCNDECIVSLKINNLFNKIDFNKKSVLFSQTTMSSNDFLSFYNELNNRINELKVENTICKFMVSREEKLKKFAKDNDLIIFVAGKNSSNGKVLYSICKEINNKTIFIENIEELDKTIISNYNNIGITGATSTPMWYLEKIKKEI